MERKSAENELRVGSLYTNTLTGSISVILSRIHSRDIYVCRFVLFCPSLKANPRIREELAVGRYSSHIRLISP